MYSFDFDIGDRVYIKYRDSKYFHKTGIITDIKYNGSDRGDCTVSIDFEKAHEIFYYTNLEKIVRITEYPNGEVFHVTYTDAINLAAVGLITYNYEKGYYYFKSDNLYQIEDYII